MNHAATTKASKFVFPERHLPLWLLPISLPTQHGIDSTQLLNVPCVLLDDNLCLTESRRLKILLVLNNLIGHLLRQNSVVLVQHAKRLLMLVFWCAHKFLTTHITGGGQGISHQRITRNLAVQCTSLVLRRYISPRKLDNSSSWLMFFCVSRAEISGDGGMRMPTSMCSTPTSP